MSQDSKVKWSNYDRYNFSPREEFELAKGRPIDQILHDRARAEEAQRRMGLAAEIDELRTLLLALAEAVLALENRIVLLEGQ